MRAIPRTWPAQRKEKKSALKLIQQAHSRIRLLVKVPCPDYKMTCSWTLATSSPGRKETRWAANKRRQKDLLSLHHALAGKTKRKETKNTKQYPRTWKVRLPLEDSQIPKLSDTSTAKWLARLGCCHSSEQHLGTMDKIGQFFFIH